MSCLATLIMMAPECAHLHPAHYHQKPVPRQEIVVKEASPKVTLTPIRNPDGTATLYIEKKIEY